jgi:hypothetical protein
MVAWVTAHPPGSKMMRALYSLLLLQVLLERHPGHRLLITTTTPAGSERVRTLFGDEVEHVYLPYELPGAARRFLNTFRPSIALIMEAATRPVVVSPWRGRCPAAGWRLLGLCCTSSSTRSTAKSPRSGTSMPARSAEVWGRTWLL